MPVQVSTVMMRSRNRQRGIAAVEFGLILPIVVVLLFAVFEFGVAFWRQQVLSAAVREGARAGVVAITPRKKKAEIEAVVLGYLDSVGYHAGGRTATATGAEGASGAPLTVTATYPTSFVILSRLPLGQGVGAQVDGAGNMTLTATVTMQME